MAPPKSTALKGSKKFLCSKKTDEEIAERRQKLEEQLLRLGGRLHLHKHPAQLKPMKKSNRTPQKDKKKTGAEPKTKMDEIDRKIEIHYNRPVQYLDTKKSVGAEAEEPIQTRADTLMDDFDGF